MGIIWKKKSGKMQCWASMEKCKKGRLCTYLLWGLYGYTIWYLGKMGRSRGLYGVDKLGGPDVSNS